jgi:hypothetical protein
MRRRRSQPARSRLGALSILDKQARGKRTSDERRAELYRLCRRRSDRIDN